MLTKVATAASPQKVWERLLRNEPMFVLDVRNRDEFERWRVDGPRSVPTSKPHYDRSTWRRGEDLAAAVMRGCRRTLQQLPLTGPSRRCAEGKPLFVARTAPPGFVS